MDIDIENKDDNKINIDENDENIQSEILLEDKIDSSNLIINNNGTNDKDAIDENNNHKKDILNNFEDNYNNLHKLHIYN